MRCKTCCKPTYFALCITCTYRANMDKLTYTQLNKWHMSQCDTCKYEYIRHAVTGE